MSIYGAWKTGVIANGGTVSAAVDLGQEYDFLGIVIPTVDAGNLSLQVADEEAGTYRDLAGDSGIDTISVSTGARSTTLILGGWRWVKVKMSVAQTAERTFKVRGWKM